MAKCVIIKDSKSQYDGRIIRVPDSMAENLVSDGRADYSSKEAWKDWGNRTVVNGRV